MKQNSYRIGGGTARSTNMSLLRHYLAPRISAPPEENGDELRRRQSLQQSQQFIPFESERDHLGRLKSINTLTTAQPASTRRITSLPRLHQKSLNTNLRDEGIVKEPIDLNMASGFRVVDGFERQINIIIRNKEFMRFLKDEQGNLASRASSPTYKKCRIFSSV